LQEGGPRFAARADAHRPDEFHAARPGRHPALFYRFGRTVYEKAGQEEDAECSSSAEARASSLEVDRFWASPYNAIVDALWGGFVLRGFLTYFTAVMLCAHAVLGCCSHHVHACGESHGPVAFVDGAHHCSDNCGGRSAGRSEQTGHEHEGQDDCQGSTCDFGRPANEQEAKSPDVFCQPVAVLLSEAAPALVGGQLEHQLGTPGVLPPIRLHLVHQVMLI
jgi:hypothetical protein